MKTNEDTVLNWELGTARRCIRGVIGAGAILVLLLVPGLNTGWLFVLAIIGAYESMTAILNADLVYGVVNLVASSVAGVNRKQTENTRTITSPLITTAYGAQGY